MNKPTFHQAWQANRPERTAEILMGRGYYAEVFSGTPPHSEMLLHYVLTTAPAEELAEVRSEVLGEWEAEMVAKGMPRLPGIPRVHDQAPFACSPGAYAREQYAKWVDSNG